MDVRRGTAALVALAVAALAGCTSATPTTGPVTPSATTAASDDAATPTPSGVTTATPQPEQEPEPTSVPPLPAVAVTGTTDVVTGLDAPWGVAFLPDGAALVTLRDRAEVVLVRDGTVTPLDGEGALDLAAGTRAGGEGGLLGVAVAPDAGSDAGPDAGSGVAVYLYRTTPGGNEVLRARLEGTTLTSLEVLLGGIPSGRIHNGGRLAFGPDGFLYVTTGDAGQTSRAQDPASLGGKILRLAPDGAPAPGNPDPASPVWSLGHRNVQGIGWAGDGTMFASEFGQNTWDELNVIVPGANYGWPSVEGAPARPGTDGFVAPVATWPTSDASPSGLAVTQEGVYLAGLRGQRLWRVPVTRGAPPVQASGAPQALLAGELGRLRDVAVAPDGSLWVVTNNTDGRGSPRPGDDRIVRVTVG